MAWRSYAWGEIGGIGGKTKSSLVSAPFMGRHLSTGSLDNVLAETKDEEPMPNMQTEDTKDFPTKTKPFGSFRPSFSTSYIMPRENKPNGSRHPI